MELYVDAIAAEQGFFLTMTSQVVHAVPEIRGGKIELPDEPDVSRLIDWNTVERHSCQP